MKHQRPLIIILSILALIAATWSFMILNAARNETLDQRVHDVASQLKCPVCQGESVADSPSTISQQMRAVIHQQLQSGKSDQQIIQYFVARYGEQIVWSPPWQGFTMLAWLVPIILLLIGTFLLFTILRNWRNATPTPSTGTDEPELADIDAAELELYRAQIEEELAESDPIFAHPPQSQRMEAN